MRNRHGFLSLVAFAALATAPAISIEPDHQIGSGRPKGPAGTRLAVPEQRAKPKSDKLKKLLANKGRR